MEQTCGAMLWRNKRRGRLLDRLVYGHWMHTCMLNRFNLSGQLHSDDCLCKCGKSWKPIFTGKN